MNRPLSLLRSALAVALASYLVGACHRAPSRTESNEELGERPSGGRSGSEQTGGQENGGTGVGGGVETATVTWHQHIAPLLVEKCGGCHVDGGIAPFSIETYEDARQWATQMDRAIQSGTMPPWGARETEECEPPAKFKDDIRLSDDEKLLFHQWVEQDRPLGDPATPSPISPAPVLGLDAPDRSLTIPSAVTVEGTADDFVCFTLDPGVTEPVWLTGVQIEAGNSAIVHHALVFLDRDGQGQELADENGQYPCFGSPRLGETVLLGAWAPGAVPSVTPDRAGTPLEPGDRLVVQVHYHPTGQGPESDDSTRIDLKWTTQQPEYVARIFLIGNFDSVGPNWAGGPGYGLTTGPDFLIPAGAQGHEEINRFYLDDDGEALRRLVPIYVWMVGTHMHYVGTDMKITATDADDNEQCLVQTPQWDFNWQRGYFFEGTIEELPTVHLGDSLTMRCTYDNSLQNPFVREALSNQGLSEPEDVLLGEETLDEMCLGIFGFAVHRDYAESFGL